MPETFILTGLDEAFILASLALHPPDTFAASLPGTLRVLYDLMRPRDCGRDGRVCACPVSRPRLCTAHFDRQLICIRADAELHTTDMVHVLLFHGEGMIKLHVVIDHHSFGIRDMLGNVTNAEIVFGKILTYQECEQVLSSVFFKKAGRLPRGGIVNKTMRGYVDEPTDENVCWSKLPDSTAMPMMVLRSEDELDMITERLATAHIDRALGVSFSLFDELNPTAFQTKPRTINAGEGIERAPVFL